VGLTSIANLKCLCDKLAVLLKQVATLESLGSKSMLASNKTGTLTQV
jgi:magnesium-transporting ATPase (P-type)